MTKTATTTQLTPPQKATSLADRDKYGVDWGEPCPGSETFVSVGDFVSTTLVTDTVIYEVIAISASGKTITLRTTKDGEFKHSESNGSPYPVVYTERVPNEDGDTFTVRRSKSGFFGGGKGGRIGRSLRLAHRIEGKPVRRVDYSF